ncbi:SigE family RNA polymerase sigma factor [Actinoallomurus vinaceus]|uniref:SigE family RNA polymerase sigma factor n=1 Tax=Actinoallomurus vinaceus TaxID=1080074 RepID=A0ABP8UMC9_9ACTN
MLSAGRPWDAQVTSFFLANHHQLRRYLIAQGCAPCDSDDIVQDAFLIVRERWETVSGYAKPKAYLYKVALRLWQRQAAKQALRRYRGDPEPRLAGLPDPRDTAATVEVNDTLIRWFRQLPVQQRKVAALRLIGGLSEVETAKILDLSLGTVKSQLNAARKRLRQLKDQDDPAKGGT